MNLSNATVGQLLVPIDDFERGVAFYRDVLGLPFLFAAPPQMAFFCAARSGYWSGFHRRARRHRGAPRSIFA
jgi:catechol 2,3-dioxygenase-like lactoylglutathione lyase family enzyme